MSWEIDLEINNYHEENFENKDIEGSETQNEYEDHVYWDYYKSINSNSKKQKVDM